MTLIKDTRVAIKQIAFSKIANTNAEYTLLNEMTKFYVLLLLLLSTCMVV